MINKIWGFLLIVGMLVLIMSGKSDIANKEILESTKNSLEMIFKIFPVVALWLGIMNIAVKSGLINKFALLLMPILRKIFPDIPKNHESFNFIASNIVANMFGLGNAATPCGLKAMESLQKINKQKDTASKSMITFLIINTTGLTVIPTTVISLRMFYGSTNPTDIVFPCFLASILSLTIALFIDRIINKLND